MNVRLKALPVVVIGAGPVGLAAAAHLLQRGLTPLLLEAGASVAANLESYRHVRLFSPWQYNIDSAARTLLAAGGWHAPAADALPSAGEVIDHYLQPLAALPALAPYIRLHHKVLNIARAGIDKVKTAGREDAPFVLRVQTPEGERDLFAQAVIDAAGTWSQQNPLGASGVPALGEQALAQRIRYGMPDILGAERFRYAGKRVLVVGAGHSAAGNLLALAQLAQEEPATGIVWAIRGDNLNRLFGGGAADQLPARGMLGERLRALQQSGRLDLHTGFHIRELRLRQGMLQILGEEHDGAAPTIEGIDQIIAATGARPDLDITRELRVRTDPWLESTDALAPLIDPNLHSCGTIRPHGHRELAHPEPGYYAIGAKSYGRAPNFLMATGYEQARSVAAALAGDLAAADDVQLVLPETGVCTTGGLLGAPASAAACCGGPAPATVDACCVLDANEKAQGHAACGCTSGKQKVRMGDAVCC